MIYEPLLATGLYFLAAVGQAKLFDRFWFVQGFFERPGNVLDCEGQVFIPVF